MKGPAELELGYGCHTCNKCKADFNRSEDHGSISEVVALNRNQCADCALPSPLTNPSAGSLVTVQFGETVVNLRYNPVSLYNFETWTRQRFSIPDTDVVLYLNNREEGKLEPSTLWENRKNAY